MANTHSDAVVVFGITGDLAHKQILPALYRLVLRGRLDVPVIGVALDDWSAEQLAERARDAVSRHFDPVDKKALDKLVSLLRYVAGDYRKPETFAALHEALGGAKHPLHYLAIPPSLFGDVASGLHGAGLAEGARLMVEKPFGRNLETAKALNASIHRFFPEEAVYRIDHFLGKEAIQNLLYFRFANSFVEPLWNRDHVDSIQVTMAEDFGIKGRGKFYDEVGAIRDVVQNHLLNVVMLLAMDPPPSGDADDLSDEKVQVLKAIRPLAPEDVVRGQFEGYLDEPGVAKGSVRETFAALKFSIQNWRWNGVPFWVRTGKELPVKSLEVVVRFRRPPVAVFDGFPKDEANYVRFRLGPVVSVALGARRKAAGSEMVGEAIELTAVDDDTADDMLPYERLIGDAIEGKKGLFTRQDAAELAWKVFDPVLDASDTPEGYAKGTWGPKRAMKDFQPVGGWVDPEV